MVLSESQLDETHKVITVTFDKDIESRTFIDFGASGFLIIDKDFVRIHNPTLLMSKVPKTVEVIDGREITDMDNKHMITIPCKINDHCEEIPTFVTRLWHYPLLLGILCLKHHHVNNYFVTGEMMFLNHGSQTCRPRPTELPTPAQKNERHPINILLKAVSAICR